MATPKRQKATKILPICRIVGALEKGRWRGNLELGMSGPVDFVGDM
jgi:hypothetical protein